MLAHNRVNHNGRTHNVFDEFDEDYLYNLKALIMLHDKFNFNWLLTKNGEFSFKRHNIDLENEIYYGFCKACRACNIRTKEQMRDLRASQTNRLNDIHVNLNTFLKGGAKVKRFSKRVLKEYENKIKIDYSYENRVNWIINNGILLNVYCKRSVPDFMKNINLNDNFNKYMIPTMFGYVDLYFGLILVDNVNLSMIKKDVQSDNYGRVLIKSAKDNTFKTFIQTNIPNTKFNYWQTTTKTGKVLTRLYHNKPHRMTKYLSILPNQPNTFTTTTTLKITNSKRRHKILSVVNLVYGQL